MKSLNELLKGVASVSNADDVVVTGLTDNSGDLQEGELFLAYPGTTVDRRDYIHSALQAGASAIVYEESGCDISNVRASTPIIAVKNLRAFVGLIAANFYSHASKELSIYAVTGTNGKTSVAHYLAQALSHGHAVGVIGTLGNGLWGKLDVASLTTPSAIHLQKTMRDFRVKGARIAVMEASSHGLAQDRLKAIAVNTAIFTNLSQDHLDYHRTMENYAAAKRRLFEIEGLENAVVNVYDEYGAELSRSLPANVSLMSYGLQIKEHEYSLSPMIKGVLQKSSVDGVEIAITSPFGHANLKSTLFGRFNAENLLAVLAALVVNEVSLNEAIDSLSTVSPVAGRLEKFSSENQPCVFVDYAHTPAALESVLNELHQCCPGKLYVVFGCGGDRDKTKRPLMGEVAETYADVIVLTDDNPRNENPDDIIASILTGISNDKSVVVERDRAKAISYCLQHAAINDIVLVAGKGHECVQIVGEANIPFSDSECVQQLMAQAA